MRFGAFIMTYERPESVRDSIDALLRQTFPPQTILVVDNGSTSATKDLVAARNDNRIQYISVGYNSGPAGAARIGLTTLADQGFDWIYWGDDDDPPMFDDAFEKLIGMISQAENMPGILGSVGHFFNRSSGNIRRVPDEMIKTTTIIVVDSIAGGQTMIVNANVVRDGILPRPELFFGFEELDFCLQVQEAGYRLMVSSDLYLKAREKNNRLNYSRPLYVKKDLASIHRQYYSARNLLYTLRKHHLYSAFILQLIKLTAKSFVGFRYGFEYGRKNFSVLMKGIFHSLSGRMGKLG